MVKIISNKVKCNQCGDIIESQSHYDLVYCSCKSVYVDGGHDYLRRGTKPGCSYIELSITEEVPDEEFDSFFAEAHKAIQEEKELVQKGFSILIDALGYTGMETFIAFIKSDDFDLDHWRNINNDFKERQKEL